MKIEKSALWRIKKREVGSWCQSGELGGGEGVGVQQPEGVPLVAGQILPPSLVHLLGPGKMV